MLKLKSKPENFLNIPSLRVEVFRFNGVWYSLHKNGLGWDAYELDGRTLYTAFVRKNNRLSMGQYKTLKFGNDTVTLRDSTSNFGEMLQSESKLQATSK
ncbi:hypothetical protein VPBG_00129 [Vibrio phage helene 12B3]|uniref:hypothetical protein n=1 Tax=Vibrio phage helene 12B3 TaxID=573173 RepID=UPI0002C093F4|nr:hypothetical protein VPBG_00129 [Vibrio phage helene 12B3]AGG57901.1 hypothetical protein VPBG_00129 [Vibrio phage helene 12B3]